MSAHSVSALLLLLAAVGGCDNQPVEVWTPPKEQVLALQGPPAEQHPDAGRVLVVVNKNSPGSIELGAYYAEKRGVPRENIVIVDVTTEEILLDWDVLRKHVIPTLKKAIEASKERIDYIVLTRGIPILLGGQYGHGFDAQIAAMNLKTKPMINGIGGNPDAEVRTQEILEHKSPYFNSSERFNSEKFGMYLVTRLDGYTLLEAKRLVDASLLAEPAQGLFLFDQAGNRKDGAMGQLQATMEAAHKLLLSRGFESELDRSATFQNPSEPLMGYVSWGSNDSAYLPELYGDLRFKPGAIAETFVSTSGRTFRETTGGQSLIADLIRGGVTGVKGYASEPYTFALAQPQILFDRYTRGWNLAESFYAASPVVHWKGIVIGDPLCAPYAGVE